MRPIHIAIAIFMLVIPSTLKGQAKYSNEFLSIGVGAAPMGMGGASVAYRSDVTSGYWNPANLTRMTSRFDASLMHAEYFAGLAKYDYLAGAWKIDPQSAVGLSLIRLGIDDIPNTLELIDEDGNLRYDRITTFSAADLAIIGSYARKTGVDGLSVGANFKVVYRHTGSFANALGFGLDAAASYQTGNWMFSAVARDVTGTFNAWRFNTDDLKNVFELTGNEIPENSLEVTLPRLILGTARKFRLNDKFELGAAFDIHLTFDGRRHGILVAGPVTADPYAGVELKYNDWLFVRAGAGNMQRIPNLDGEEAFSLQPNMGMGIRYRQFFIDYALTNIGTLSGGMQYSNLISLRLTVE